MNPTKQQKVLAAVLTVGVIAIGIDRLTASSGDPASAAADPSVYAVPTSERSALNTATSATESHQSLASRLRNYATDAQLNLETPIDAFSSNSQRTSTTAIIAAPSSFESIHRLTGIVSMPNGGGHAMIDGQIVQVGQMFEGYRLVQLGFRTATFERVGVLVELSMTPAH